MKSERDQKVSDLKIAYIGGGSRGWAWRLMADFALEPKLSGTIALYDIDREAAKRNEVIGNALSARNESIGKWRYYTADDLKEALSGADFVIISILPGTFDEMEVDVHTPEKFGIWQSVGDTAGPGGLSRALRTIPMFVKIAEAIKDYSPQAWVINYTNPMSLCVKTLYNVYPEIKAFGCCHEVFGTQKLLGSICEEELGLTGVKRSEVHVNVLGINHFTWFNEASYQGIDLFPVYKKHINKKIEKGFMSREITSENNSDRANAVKFDLFRRFGFIAAAGDSHLVEFMPGDEYLKNPDTIKYWRFRMKTVAGRKEELTARLAKSERLAKGEEEIEIKPSGEEGILLIKALCGLDRIISNVNIPNKQGQISNLPRHAVVETNAIFSKDSIKTVFAGELPDGIRALILPHVENHEDIYKAATECSFDLALKALMNDPNVKAKCNVQEGTKLLHELISGTSTYLPEAWKR